MPDSSSPSPSLDGIAAPTAPSAPSAPTSETHVPPVVVRRSLIGLVAFALAYILPALVLLALFPRADGALTGLRAFGNGAYAIGALGIVLVALVALSRIAAVKDRPPRMKITAVLRLALYVLPLLLLSAGVLLKINLPPSLSLQVLSPTTQAQLIAPVEVTLGLPVAYGYFQSLGLSPLKFEWDFNGDNQIDQESFDPEGTYIYAKSGVFLVTCRVTMTSGEMRTLTYRLVIPRAGVGVQPVDPVIDEPAAFSVAHLFSGLDEKAPKLVRAKWDFDSDGVVDLETEAPTASFTYHRLGPVSVSVVLTLSNQTQTTLTRALQVTPPPEQPFPITLETEPATLLGSPPFGVLFALKTQEKIASATWDFGNRKSAEGLRVAQVFAEAGTYTVTATVRAESGSVARLTKVVRVTNALQIPDLSFDGVPPVRSFALEGRVPLEVDLTPTTALPLISFSWDIAPMDEVDATTKQLRGVFRDPGTYYADIIGIDPDQRVFRRRLRILALPPESFVTFTMNPDAPIAPATIQFDASDVFIPGEEITGFEWDFGDASAKTTFTGARTEHRYTKPGTYTITLTVRVTSGKSFQDKKTLVVRAPLLDACFLPSRRSGPAPLGVTFDPSCSTGDITSWRWNFGDGSESDERAPTHVFSAPGEYAVTLTVVTSSGQSSTVSSPLSISSP